MTSTTLRFVPSHKCRGSNDNPPTPRGHGTLFPNIYSLLLASAGTSVSPKQRPFNRSESTGKKTKTRGPQRDPGGPRGGPEGGRPGGNYKAQLLDEELELEFEAAASLVAAVQAFQQQEQRREAFAGSLSTLRVLEWPKAQPQAVLQDSGWTSNDHTAGRCTMPESRFSTHGPLCSKACAGGNGTTQELSSGLALPSRPDPRATCEAYPRR